jgi:hypothetical protein
MLTSAIVVTVWSQMLPKGQRVFHQLGVIILGMSKFNSDCPCPVCLRKPVTASLAYFAMASALGRAVIPTESIWVS